MEKEQRTLLQNKSLHKYFELLADALNDAGWGVKKLLTRKPEVEIPWDKGKVKELLWKPIQEAVIDKESTTEADTSEYSKVYDVLNRYTSENLGVGVPWPHKEEN